MYLYDLDLTRYWALDLETDGLKPTVIHCAVAKNLGTGDTKEFYDGSETTLRDWLRQDITRNYIGHNFISFDRFVIDELVGFDVPVENIIDTLVLSYLYNPYPQDSLGHSLGAYGKRLSFPKVVHEDWSRFSPEMLHRCRTDVELTEKTYLALAQRMRSLGYSEKSCSIEHLFAGIISEQTRNGFWFDVDRAKGLLSDLRQLQPSLSEQIQILFPPRRTAIKVYPFRRRKDGSPYAYYKAHHEKYDEIRHNNDETYTAYNDLPFNIASPKQRVLRLLELGWEPTEFTEPTKNFPKGQPKVNEDELVKFARQRNDPRISAVAEWLVLNARCSMLENWLSYVQPDHRIHGVVFSCGAGTRRCRHNNPNTSNIPSELNEAKYGKEMRECWGIEDKTSRRLVGYDAKGLESVGLCHYLNSQAANNVILAGDFHQFNADNLTKALSFTVIRGGGGAKTLFYAFLYGAGNPKLGRIIKHGAKEGKVIRETLIATVPGLRELTAALEKEFEASGGILRCIDGGFVRCPSAHSALNYKIQSLGTILMKQAAIFLDQEIKYIGLDARKVSDVHDEGIFDVLKQHTEIFGKIAVAAIEAAGITLGLTVPVTGSYKVGIDWYQTH